MRSARESARGGAGAGCYDAPGRRVRGVPWPMHHVAVLGSGQMGLVCTAILASAPPQAGSVEGGIGDEPPEIGRIAIWGHELDAQHRLAQVRTSPLLEGFTLPERVGVALTDAQM